MTPADDRATRGAIGRRAFLSAVGAVVLAGCDAGRQAAPTTTAPPAGSTSSPATSVQTPATWSTTTTASQRLTASSRSMASTTTSRPSSTTSGTTVITTTTPTSTISSRTTAGRPDYAALAKSLDGDLVLPDGKAYRQTAELFNPRFDDVHPQAVAQCSSPADVAECVAFASSSGVPLAIRSGGHCYEGWSVGPGLVVDTRPIHAVKTGPGTATVGAGAHLIDVYSTLADSGVGISGGSCPTVGIAGLTLGGGLGVIDRLWGLACDNLTAVDVVTADGKTLHCSGSRNADLFWACRGGAGGTFGVVTSFTFRTRPIVPLATWGRSWPWTKAAAVVDAWLRWVPDAPDELWGSVHLASAPGSATPSVSVVGTFAGGDVSSVDRVLEGLEAAVGSAPSSQYTNPHTFLDAMMIDAGCGDKSLAQCHLEPAGTVERQAYAGSSDWIDKPLSSAGTATLLHGIEQRHDTPGVPDVAVQLDASGGAINRVKPGATAFVHRSAICSVQYIANWYDDTSSAGVKSAAAWPHRTRHAMQPYVSGRAYQNYVDAEITNWQQAYFGANYRRLQRVKAAYDPQNLFHHPQSVTA